MDKKCMKRFLVDKLGLIITYYVGLISVIIFFNLTGKSPVETIYPVIIITTVLVLYLMGAYCRYYHFYKDIQSGDFQEIDGGFMYSLQQQKVMETMEEIHRAYVHNLNEERYNHLHQTRLQAQWIHNMKTPLSVMDMVMNRCKEEGEMTLHMLEEMEQEKDLLLHHLSQQLHMVRMSEFQKDFQAESACLVTMLRESINHLKRQFIYRGIYPEVICDQKEVPILTDRKWHLFILEQLLSNGIKYSPSSCGKKVRCFVEQEGETVKLVIEDQGVGIADHDLPRIFEPFYTGDNGRVNRHATGIGLYLVKVICEKLGHKIRITSKPQEGTKVTITYLSKL